MVLEENSAQIREFLGFPYFKKSSISTQIREKFPYLDSAPYLTGGVSNFISFIPVDFHLYAVTHYPLKSYEYRTKFMLYSLENNTHRNEFVL